MPDPSLNPHEFDQATATARDHLIPHFAATYLKFIDSGLDKDAAVALTEAWMRIFMTQRRKE